MPEVKNTLGLLLMHKGLHLLTSGSNLGHRLLLLRSQLLKWMDPEKLMRFDYSRQVPGILTQP